MFCFGLVLLHGRRNVVLTDMAWRINRHGGVYKKGGVDKTWTPLSGPPSRPPSGPLSGPGKKGGKGSKITK